MSFNIDFSDQASEHFLDFDYSQLDLAVTFMVKKVKVSRKQEMIL
jgi:hypothetical protein